MKPEIDPEFAKLIPPHSEADRTALEEGIKLARSGRAQAVAVWFALWHDGGHR